MHADPPSAIQADSAVADSPDVLFKHPLWMTPPPDYLDPTVITAAGEKNPTLRFWANWYDGYLNGTPLDWELQRRIALIPDEEWEAGPARIAERIEEIKRRMEAERFENALSQAAVLKKQPKLMATVASGLSVQIAMALSEWAAVSNTLPEALEPLERLQGHCDGIAARLKAEAPEDEIAKLIVAMAGTIGELNRRLAATRAELRAGTAQPSKAELRRTGFHTRLGERKAEMLTSKWLWGAIFGGALTMMGPSQTDAVASLGQCYDDMIGPDAIYPPEMWAVPDYSRA